MDKETQKELTAGEKMVQLVASDGWQIIKQKFTDKIMDLQSIKNLSHVTTATALQKEITIRTQVVDILYEMIKEIEGEANQASNNKELFKGAEADQIIARF